MILDEIVSAKRLEVRRAREERPWAELKAKARNAAPVPAFELRHAGAVSVIAEIKRASPAKGPLRPDLDPEAMALAYKAGGARAISVLTDGTFFKGSIEDLRKARDAAGLPVLRKDFVIDEYQLWETKVLRASAVLLIVRILDQARLSDYLAIAREELKLAALVEVHSEKELERALDVRAPLVGINNRDLDTFKVDLATTARLRPLLPRETVVVSESGISTRDDMVLLKQMGVDAALIGEELVKAPDPEKKLKELLG